MTDSTTNIQLDIGSGNDIAAGILDGVAETFKRWSVALTRMTAESSMALAIFAIFLVVGLRFWRLA